MAKVKPFKHNGVWMFSDGTAIPDQQRAASDARYRDSSNNLHLLIALNNGNRKILVNVDDVRVKCGWDGPSDAEIESQIMALSIKLGIDIEVDTSEDEAATCIEEIEIQQTFALINERQLSLV